MMVRWMHRTIAPRVSEPDPSPVHESPGDRGSQPVLEAIGHEYVSCVSAYSEVHVIVSALRSLVGGVTLLPPQVQRALTERLRQPSSPPKPLLTSREEQVLELAATELTISQIAAKLHISHSTAKTHLLRVYEKLEAPNRSAAVAIAVARGVLRLSAAVARSRVDERLAAPARDVLCRRVMQAT